MQIIIIVIMKYGSFSNLFWEKLKAEIFMKMKLDLLFSIG